MLLLTPGEGPAVGMQLISSHRVSLTPCKCEDAIMELSSPQPLGS